MSGSTPNNPSVLYVTPIMSKGNEKIISASSLLIHFFRVIFSFFPYSIFSSSFSFFSIIYSHPKYSLK